MKIEIESSKNITPIRYYLDGELKIGYLDAGEVIKLNPRRDPDLTDGKDDAESINPRINDKQISAPTKPDAGNPNVGDFVRLIIKKGNLDRLLPSGKIHDHGGVSESGEISRQTLFAAPQNFARQIAGHSGIFPNPLTVDPNDFDAFR